MTINDIRENFTPLSPEEFNDVYGLTPDHLKEYDGNTELLPQYAQDLLFRLVHLDYPGSYTLAQLRERTALSQRQFSRKYGISLQLIRKWENGQEKIPEFVLSTLTRLCAPDFTSNKINGKSDFFIPTPTYEKICISEWKSSHKSYNFALIEPDDEKDHGYIVASVSGGSIAQWKNTFEAYYPDMDYLIIQGEIPFSVSDDESEYID